MHLFAITLLLGAAQAVLVPHPPGPYDVAVNHIELVDPSRIDSLAPVSNTKRRTMASAYLPVDAQHGCKTQIVPYMPPLTASIIGKLGETLGLPQGTLESFEMEFCDISTVTSDNSYKAKKDFPVVLFSPGFGGSRLLYGAMVRSLASHGYIVLTLDHTYETNVVEFPDGSAIYPSSNDTATPAQLEARTEDESFLISQLSNATFADSLFANFPGTFNPRRIVVYGHSFGGATAAVTAQRDPRVIAGLDLDGTIYGPVVQEGFKGKPFVLVGSDGSQAEWAEFYKNIDGAKMELTVNDTRHYAFTDTLLLLTAYQLPPEALPTLHEMFGTVDGRTLETVVNEVMIGFLELALKGNTGPLKDLGNNAHVEVRNSNL